MSPDRETAVAGGRFPLSLVEAIDAALPQTQCRRCGEPDCRRYAEAIAAGRADIDRCPPGGAEGIVRLAALTGRPPRPLDPACGREGPRQLAVIDESLCIGCTLCIQACPVDCIVGTAKRMHTVIESECTGCELCLPACPVDCIALVAATPGRSGWQAWSPAEAAAARARYTARESRRARRRAEREQRLAARAAAGARGATGDPAGTRGAPVQAPRPEAAAPEDRKRAAIAEALARARARRAGG